MLNRNANCYNIEKNFKYSTVISTFSEHIIIFRTLSIDIWQLKCQQRQTKNGLSDFIEFICLFIICRIIKFFFVILLREATLESKVVSTNLNSSAFLFQRWVVVHFLQTFLEIIYATTIQRKYWNNQLSKKYCVDYVFEQLKYCSQITEY